MNKKRLSVVMAGAMLASSVAPVLAAEETTVEKTEINKGVLINDLAQKIWEAPRFSDDVRVGKINGVSLVGKSVYGIQVGDNDPVSLAKSVSPQNTKAELQAEIKGILGDLKVGDVVKLVDLGHRTVKEEKDGKEVELVLSTNETTKYTKAELANGVSSDGSLAKEIDSLKGLTGFTTVVNLTGTEYVEGKGFVIKFNSKVDTNNDGVADAEELVLTEKTDRLDLGKFYNGTNSDTTAFATGTPALATGFHGFPKSAARHLDIDTTVVSEYTIVADGVGFELSDLYQSPFLTTKGQELLDAVKESELILGTNTVNANSNTADGAKTDIVRFVDANKYPTGVVATNSETTVPATLTKDNNGVYKVRIGIANSYKIAESLKANSGTTWKIEPTDYDEYIISSKSEKELQKILEWINAGSAKVDRVVGANRYATAVKLAKEADLAELKATDGSVATGKKNIVLVNGNSLVDGLAAAPLAKHLAGERGNAPILLTEADSLPTATKRYLKELVDTQTNKDVTVNIVGGDAVVSKSIERELKSMNLKVERFGGEDREATSMAVAEEVGFDNGAFVVGANGEADAMSISGKAAQLKTPVVVSSYKGLSEDTLSELEDVRVTVLGGEKAVSEAEFEKIESVAKTSRRIFGANRKATNAAIINTFYKKDLAGAARSVLVAKDDVLVDALAAANLSAVENAPIVLATKDLSSDQLGAVVLNANNAKKVYQIGGGVAESVVRAIADALNFI